MNITTTIKQKLCTHNWTTVESATTREVIRQYLNSGNSGKYTEDHYLACVPQFSAQVLHDKVCLKCKEVDAELTKFRNRLETITFDELDRAKNRVQQMFIASAKRAANARKEQFEARVILREYLII